MTIESFEIKPRNSQPDEGDAAGHGDLDEAVESETGSDSQWETEDEDEDTDDVSQIDVPWGPGRQVMVEERPLEFLQPYINRGILLSLLTQDVLREATDALGEYTYSSTLSKHDFRFVPPAGSELAPLVFRCHLVASVAPGPHSVLWGHASVLPHCEDEPNQRMLAVARRDTVPELLEEDTGFDEYFSDPESITRVIAPRVAIAIVGMTDMSRYYSMPAGPAGQRMILLLDDVNHHLPPLTLTNALERLPRIMGEHSTGIVSLRAAVLGLAEARGWSIVDEGKRIVVEDEGARAAFMIDGGENEDGGMSRSFHFEAAYKD